ncbi:sensor domain-containing diguanylate cyclase [Terriglobus aquaticus]|uniref:diguanylate cyclase n=1 Tax=Terriglobus aquaticus TaxID=940139 RepID=A0ABW9KJ45_9BACT|nr:diguanylate cyclase [Terriglobus aquaticus]
MFEPPLDPATNMPGQNEEQRLRALYEQELLDTAPESEFDEAVSVAAAICGAASAVVNLLDRDRQWFKARTGIDYDQTPRNGALCNHLIGTDDLLVIPDAIADPRFMSNPFVVGEPGIRFYAAMPLNTREGFTLGSLCVMDREPRVLNAGQQDALRALGRQVAAQIELRSSLHKLRDRVAEKDRAERDLRERNRLFSAFMDHSPAIGFIKDASGRFIYYNKLFCERFAVSQTEWIGKSVFDLFPPEFATAYHENDLAVLTSGVPKVIEETSPGPDGSIMYWRSHKFRVETEDGTCLLGGLSLDVSSEQEAVSRLRKLHADLTAANVELAELSTTDALTGLSNRRALDERLSRQLQATTSAAFILLDLDHFKALNDTYGHPFGDSVLQTTARLLKSACRAPDCVARMGGEEFAILLVNADGNRAMEIAERLRQTVEQHPWTERPVTASFGVTLCSPSKSVTQTLAEADQALYQAKAAGRNRVCSFDSPVAS